MHFWPRGQQTTFNCLGTSGMSSLVFSCFYRVREGKIFGFAAIPPQLSIVAQLSILAGISKRVFVRRRKVVYVSSTVGISCLNDVKKSLIPVRNTSGPQCTFFRVFLLLYAVFFEMCRLVLLTDSRPFPQFLDWNVILRLSACKIDLTFLVFSSFSSFFDAFLDESSSWLYHCVLVFVQWKVGKHDVIEWLTLDFMFTLVYMVFLEWGQKVMVFTDWKTRFQKLKNVFRHFFGICRTIFRYVALMVFWKFCGQNLKNTVLVRGSTGCRCLSQPHWSRANHRLNFSNGSPLAASQP